MKDKNINCEFTTSELFQIHLALISRNAFATQKWASASNAEEQKQMQAEIAFLDDLTKKVIGLLNSASAPEEEKGSN